MSFDQDKLLELIADDLLYASEFGQPQDYLDLRQLNELENESGSASHSSNQGKWKKLENPRESEMFECTDDESKNRNIKLSIQKKSIFTDEEQIILQNRRIAQELLIKNNSAQYRNCAVVKLFDKYHFPVIEKSIEKSEAKPQIVEKKDEAGKPEAKPRIVEKTNLEKPQKEKAEAPGPSPSSSEPVKNKSSKKTSRRRTTMPVSLAEPPVRQPYQYKPPPTSKDRFNLESKKDFPGLP